jgi:flagellar FliL protein
LGQADFRKNLADKIRKEFNAILEKYEDFGGIEEVYFTSFVVQ